MKIHYYDKVQKASVDLDSWLAKDDAPNSSWSEFTKKTLSLYGFGNKRMAKMLREEYPELTIVDDRVVKL